MKLELLCWLHHHDWVLALIIVIFVIIISSCCYYVITICIIISSFSIWFSLFCHNYYYHHGNHIPSLPSLPHSLDSTSENAIANADGSPLPYQMNWSILIMQTSLDAEVSKHYKNETVKINRSNDLNCSDLSYIVKGIHQWPVDSPHKGSVKRQERHCDVLPKFL